MANLVYNRFTYNLMAGLVDLSVDTIKCALVTNAYTPDADHNVWADISGDEVVGEGYTAGGEELENVGVTQDDDNDKSVFDADDVTWYHATFTARYAVLYDDDLEDDDLICLIDFGSDRESDEQCLFIVWHTDGIITLYQKEE